MERFSFWLGLVGLILGAIFGAIDLETLGGIVGGIVGLFAGALIGEIIDLSIGPFIGEKRERTVSSVILRLIGIALLVVLCHELFWLVNFVSLTATHNIGARITQTVARNDSAKAVQDNLKDKRWQVSVFLARPTRWLVVEAVQAQAKAMQVVIEDVAAGRLAPDATLHARGKDLSQEAERLIDRYMARTWLLRFLPREVLIPKE